MNKNIFALTQTSLGKLGNKKEKIKENENFDSG